MNRYEAIREINRISAKADEENEERRRLESIFDPYVEELDQMKEGSTFWLPYGTDLPEGTGYMGHRGFIYIKIKGKRA